MTITPSEFDPFDVIDLQQALRPEHIERIRELYTLMHWDWFPPEALKWRFADVCALYFRVRHYIQDGDQITTLLDVHIRAYLQDEFA